MHIGIKMHRHGMTASTDGAIYTGLTWSHGCRSRSRGKGDKMTIEEKIKEWMSAWVSDYPDLHCETIEGNVIPKDGKQDG